MKSFFEDKFEFDFRANDTWIQHLSELDERPGFVEKSMAHIINVHHIWVSRLSQIAVESGSWDALPSMHWISLNQDNFRKTIAFLEHEELTRKIYYHDEEGVPMEKSTSDVLYHILSHSQYHRAQIVMSLKQHDLPVPSMNFVVYR